MKIKLPTLTPLQRHVRRWEGCRACPLCGQRSRVVLARGAVPCDVLLCGEAPGASEDALGVPFCGPAGKLLDRVVAASVPPDLRIAFTNLVCCFPREAKTRGDSQPAPSEIEACRGRLVEFVRIARPRLVVLVGRLARRWVTGASMFRLDGEDEQPEWIEAGRCLEFVEIDHPAYILRMPEVAQSGAIKKAVLRVRNAVEGLSCRT